MLDELCEELCAEFNDDKYKFEASTYMIICKYRGKKLCFIEVASDYVQLTIAYYTYCALIDCDNIWASSSLEAVYKYPLELPNCFDLMYFKIRELVGFMEIYWRVRGATIG